MILGVEYCCSAHCKWCIICDEDESWESFLGRRNIWWLWRVGSVAPRIVNHASYVTRINFEIILRFFSWQAQIFGGVGGLCTPNLCPGRGDAAGKTRKRKNGKTGKRRMNLRLACHHTKTRKHEKRKRENEKTRKGENAKIRNRENWACAQKRFEHERYHSLGHVWSEVCTEAVHSVALSTRTLSRLWACVKYVPKQSILLALWTRTLSQHWAMCKVGTEAVHSVAPWTWTLSQVWTCVKLCTEAVHCVSLWARTLSQVWACVYRVCTDALHCVSLWTRTFSQHWTCVKYVPKQSIP